MKFDLVPFSSWELVPLYIDPGTGALLWQFLVGTGLGVLFFMGRIKNWIKARLHNGDEAEEEPSAESASAMPE